MPPKKSSKKRNTNSKTSRSKSSKSSKSSKRPSRLSPFFENINEESSPPSPPTPVEVAPMKAPTSNKDPRFLGKGSSKMIWLMHPNQEMDEKQLPRMDKVMVNAYTSQLLKDQNGTEEEIIAARMEEQRNEFHFTRMVRAEFPDLIPQVYELVQDNYLPQPRFRYTKDRCEKITENNELFYHMIRISDRIIDQGWVYSDMKPGNVGLFEGRVLLIDTDPASFYRIPMTKQAERVKRFYRISCHMIILLFCLNYVGEIETEVLQDFIRSKRYTIEIFREIYDTEPLSSASIAHYNNRFAENGHYPVQFHDYDIMPPKTFLRHYGHYGGLHALILLQQLLEY